jgi:hypothetical protein
VHLTADEIEVILALLAVTGRELRQRRQSGEERPGRVVEVAKMIGYVERPLRDGLAASSHLPRDVERPIFLDDKGQRILRLLLQKHADENDDGDED